MWLNTYLQSENRSRLNSSAIFLNFWDLFLGELVLVFYWTIIKGLLFVIGKSRAPMCGKTVYGVAFDLNCMNVCLYLLEYFRSLTCNTRGFHKLL